MKPTVFSRNAFPGLLAMLLGAFAGLLTGCGSSGTSGATPTPVSAKGTVADLRGNWLIGTMPPGPMSGTPSFGAVLNLDIINGRVAGFASLLLPCAIGGVLAGAVGGGTRLEPANVNADGTFTLTDALVGPVTQHSLVVTAALPAIAGGVWSGTYTAAAPLASCNGVAVPSQTGSFTVQPVADLSGTFVGTSTLQGTNTPVAITMSLTQGGSTSLNGISTRINDQNVLNGTIQVQGISCFKSGTVKTATGFPEGSLTGNQPQVEFLMDDGSTVLFHAMESDTAAKTLTFASLLVSGGACDKSSILFTSLAKQ